MIDFANSRLCKPPGPIARRLDGCVVCLAGISCFLSFYLIEFHICQKHDCEKLEVTSFFINMSALYIVYGIVVLMVGVFLFRDRSLTRLQRFGIEMTACIGAILSGMVVFGMLKEISSIG